MLSNLLKRSLLRSKPIPKQRLLVKPIQARYFSSGRPPFQGGNNDQADGYSTDEDGKNFESDRRFSNYIMFLGAFSMVTIFMIANVVQLKK